MKIALYHPWLHTKGGAEKTVLRLLQNSSHDITIYTTRYEPENTFEEFQDYDVNVIGNIPIKGYLFRGLSFTLANLFTSMDLSGYDRFMVSTSGVAEFITFRNHSIPVIGFCHTPLRAAHDETVYNRNIEERGILGRNLYRFAVKTYEFIEQYAWNKFDHVIFNSENTRQRAMDASLFERERTSVVHPGVDTDDALPGNYDEYFFYPSRFKPYKRQDLAIDAFEHFQRWNVDKDFRLIVAGSLKEEDQEYYQELEKKVEDVKGAELRTNVDEDEWRELYRNCYGVLFTAENEDWGITPVEAAGYGKPVISVDEGGPQESVVDGETGYLVNSNPLKLAEAMDDLLENPEKVKEMGKNGLRHAEKFTWKKFVSKVDEILESQ